MAIRSPWARGGSGGMMAPPWYNLNLGTVLCGTMPNGDFFYTGPGRVVGKVTGQETAHVSWRVS
eukprot:7255785-Karenia_brevis.AAC.1